MKPPGQFDEDYSTRISNACVKAIVAESLDPETNTTVLRNAEIYGALMRIMATMVATSKAADTPADVQNLAVDFAKDLIKHIATAKATMQRPGRSPFSVIHPEDLQ